ncbi:MAG: radical SAM protein, partial [Deltaproteobacteria bacterium]
MENERIEQLLRLPLAQLIAAADKTRREFAGSNLELCNIMNAKSGICDQDCKFCAQASSRSTGAPVYPLKKKKEMLEAARRAKDIGAERFDIVTSGDALSKEELGVICDAVAHITSKVGIKMCASLGTLDEGSFRVLKAAGLSRYHHNIETSPRYFPNIVT